MKSISSWSTLICMSAVVCSIVELILPSGKMAKTLQMILGLFMLVSLVLPFSNGIPKFEINLKTKRADDSNIKDFINNLNKQIETLAENNLKSAIKEILEEMGIENKKIEILMDTNQENCISISKCKVYIKKNSKRGGNDLPLTSSDLLKIKKELETKINIETQVFICD